MVSRIEQLTQLVEACSLELTEEDINYLELYKPVDNLLTLGTSEMPLGIGALVSYQSYGS